MFKVGDKVVAKLDHDFVYYCLEKRDFYVVKGIKTHSDGTQDIIIEQGNYLYHFDTFRFELEEIYNSPLYKNMREEENEQ